MKIIANALKFGKAALRDAPIANHIPYTRHVTSSVIALDNGAIVSVIKLNGLYFQTLDQPELNLRATVQNTILKGLGSSRYSIWSTVIRREVNVEDIGQFEDNFTGLLDARYMSHLREKRMYTNDIYLSVVRTEQRGVLGIADQLKRKIRDGFEKRTLTSLSPEVVELQERIEAMANEMAPYGPTVLGIVEREGQPYSEPVEFFNSIAMCGVPLWMRLPRMELKRFIGLSRLYFGKKSIQLDGRVEAEKRFASMLSIKEYPQFTAPGMLDNLLKVNHEFILTQTFTITDKPIALERISRVQRQIGSSDASGSALETDVTHALNSLHTGEAIFGYHHLSICAISRNLETLGKAVSELGSCLTESGIAWLREDLNSEPAFWAQFPGNHAYIARLGMCSSLNFAGFSSMHNFPVGRFEGLPWKVPISLLETTSQTPYHFNFHNSQGLGHFLITGPSGSGKTVALTFLLAQAARVNPTPKSVFFDKDHGAEIFIRAMGGRYEELDPDRPTGFNPLQLDNTASNRDFLTQLLRVMLGVEGSGGDLDQEQFAILERAVSRIMEYPRNERKLSNLRDLLVGSSRGHSDDLAARISPWIDGEKQWIFNAEYDRLSLTERQLFGFDMTKILSMPDVCAPVLMYLFYRVQEMLNGEPTLIFMDEGWQLLNNKAFASFIVDLMKTIRKRNGIVGFGTQSAADIVRSEVSNTLIEQTAIHIHFPNARADEESYVDRFLLSSKEFAFIRGTGPESRTFLIKTGSESVIARLDLSKMRDFVKVLSGTETTVRECAALRDTLGDDPKDWLPKFCGWEVSDAAE